MKYEIIEETSASGTPLYKLEWRAGPPEPPNMFYRTRIEKRIADRWDDQTIRAAAVTWVEHRGFGDLSLGEYLEKLGLLP